MRLCYDTLTSDEAAVGLAGIAAVVARANAGGRPYSFTPQREDDYLERILAGDGRDQAARNVGVTPNTARAHRRLDPTFEARIIEAEKERIQILESAAFRHAVDGNARLTEFLLTNWAPEKYSDRRGPHIAQQINAGGPVESVEWSLQDARAEVLGMIDELEERRQQKALEGSAVDVESREADGP